MTLKTPLLALGLAALGHLVFLPAPAALGANTFAPTGSLAKGRSAPTATLLPNGRVLVADRELGGGGNCVWLAAMSATQIIAEIQRLPPTEQAEVVQFAFRLEADRMLSGAELGALAQRMVDATDPAEALLLRDAFMRGFYGGKVEA